MKISADRGKLTDGHMYKLDGDQRTVLDKVREDHVQATKCGEIKGTKKIRVTLREDPEYNIQQAKIEG